jgi:hypothetical protein
MTTREAVAVPRTEEKPERKGWCRLKTAAAAVLALPGLLVALLADAAVFDQVEAEDDGFD